MTLAAEVLSEIGKKSVFSSREYFANLSSTIENLNHAEWEMALELVRAGWERGAHFYTMGNGGSALNALHYLADWNKSVKMATGRPIYATSLADNVGLLTAYANDVAYEDCFLEQLRGEIRRGDILIAISGSGNSENIVRAARYAREQGATVIGLCGFDGGRLKPLCDVSVWVRSYDMQICEDVHLSFGHIVMRTLASRGRDHGDVDAETGQ